MASLISTTNRKTGKANGYRMVQFIDAEGKRRSVRLGKMSLRAAESIKTKIEALNSAATAKQTPDRETAAWVGSLDSTFYDKLANVGLVQPRQQADPKTLEAFIDGYIAGRTDVKPGTIVMYNHTKDLLLEFFDPNQSLDSVSPGDVDDWRRYLQKQGYADNTIRRRCGIARQFFKYAVRKQLISENPFAEIDGGVTVRANRSRDYFVSRDEAAEVLKNCPDAQWKLLFALSRYGGLRCPSEHLSLSWGDVDWENDRLTVPSPKTEHHDGKAYRVIPIFPELREHLQTVYDEQLEDFDPKRQRLSEQPIITRYRGARTNLRTQLQRILKKAGLKPWPKLFQNLRSTRETELAEEFPIHVVCDWIGNSQAVAKKHYLQTTDDHFDRAVDRSGRALHKALQHTAARSEMAGSGEKRNPTKPAEPLKNSVTKLARQDSNLE